MNDYFLPRNPAEEEAIEERSKYFHLPRVDLECATNRNSPAPAPLTPEERRVWDGMVSRRSALRVLLS